MSVIVESHVASTEDGFSLALTRSRLKSADTSAIPVLMVHGAGVRSRIFRPPRADEDQLDHMLAVAGFDVWNLDWRASIDQAPNEWTLDQAAMFDYPAAVARITEVTGASEVRALVHCQGSTSFMISLCAGLLPEISMVVSNAVSLHPVVPALARAKALYAVPTLGRFMPYLNPQWGLSAPRGLPWVFDQYVRTIHHECNNPVCKWSSFTFGSGFPTLWRHENLTEATHDWLAGEFAHVPMTFFRQIGRSIKAGHLVSTGEFDRIPASVVAAAPRSDARIVLLAGQVNDCFVPEAQARSWDFLDRHAPGRHSFVELAGYGHLDVFIGRNAPADNFPLIVAELQKG
jgi:hypothetical protein